MNIELHIERLILDGVNMVPGHRQEFQIALETELTRLLLAEGLNASLLSGGALRSLDSRPLSVTDQMSGTHLGHHIAHSIGGSIGPGYQASSTQKSK